MARSRATPVATSPKATAMRPAIVAAGARAGLLYAVLIIGLIGTTIPFVWMIAGSFKTNTDLFGNMLQLLPSAPTVHNYIDLLQGSQIPYLRQYANSVIVAASTTVNNRTGRSKGSVT